MVAKVAQRGFAANRGADGRVVPSAGRPGVSVACGIPVFENSPRGQTARLSALQLRNLRSAQRNKNLVVQAFSSRVIRIDLRARGGARPPSDPALDGDCCRRRRVLGILCEWHDVPGPNAVSDRDHGRAQA
jgi:hypothetical protein